MTCPVFPTAPQFDEPGHTAADQLLARREAAQSVTTADLLDELACRLGSTCFAVEGYARLRVVPESIPARRLLAAAYEKYGAYGVLQALRDQIAGERLRKNVKGLLRGEAVGLARAESQVCPPPPDGCGIAGDASHESWCPKSGAAAVEVPGSGEGR